MDLGGKKWFLLVSVAVDSYKKFRSGFKFQFRLFCSSNNFNSGAIWVEAFSLEIAKKKTCSKKNHQLEPN